MVDKILDVCMIIAIFAFCFCVAAIDSPGTPGVLSCIGCVLSVGEFCLIVNYEGLQW